MSGPSKRPRGAIYKLSSNSGFTRAAIPNTSRFAWDDATRIATVTIRQQQQTGTEHGVETPLFDMPVTLLFALPEGEVAPAERGVST